MTPENHPWNHAAANVWAAVFLAAGVLFLVFIYVFAFIRSSRKGRAWPLHRLCLWVFGASTAIFGILASSPAKIQSDFVAHMTSHLLFGMLASILMALATPVTLILRALDVKRARKLASFLKSPPLRVVTHPAAAAVLNVGGLWLLYATGLFGAMHEDPYWYFVVHAHIFIAGYVFSSAILGNEPNPHQSSYVFRAIILILALAGHSMLSKYIYAHPPASVPVLQAQEGAMLMYYGGDAVEAILIWAFCRKWYDAARPRANRAQVKG